MTCPVCGAQIPDDAAFCPLCGAKVTAEEASAQEPKVEPEQPKQEYNYTNYSEPVYQGYMAKPTVEIRNVALNIVLSLVTCGIYSLVWAYNIISDTKKVVGETDGVVGEFLLFVLVPFYSIYWFYSREKRFVEASARYGISVEDKSIIMLVLSLFGFGIINLALMQDDLNKFYGA